MYSLDRPSARVIGRVDDYDDDYDDDDTIELELNEAAIRALTEAAALALATSERADPRLTPEAHAQGTRGFAPETPANERVPAALGREAAAAGQAGEAFEQETPTARAEICAWFRHGGCSCGTVGWADLSGHGTGATSGPDRGGQRLSFDCCPRGTNTGAHIGAGIRPGSRTARDARRPCPI